MSMQDPISDMLTRIRNAQMVGIPTIEMPASRVKQAIAKVLKAEGYIVDYSIREEGSHKYLIIELKYMNEVQPVITSIRRVSKPGLRQYTTVAEMPVIMEGMGIAIVSTSKGIMTGRQAIKEGQGGEVLCSVA